MSADRAKHLPRNRGLSGNPEVEAWVTRLVESFHMYDDPAGVRCYLGHCSDYGPWLELLLQSSDGDTIVKLIHLTGRLDASKGDPRVRDGVQAIHLLALFLDRIDRTVVLEHGEAFGRCGRHPVFTKPYHAFDDKALPWERDKGPPVLDDPLASFVARHAAAVRGLGPIATIDCSVSAHREDGQEIYRCEFTAAMRVRHVLEFRVTSRNQLLSTPVEVLSLFEALRVLSHLLREVRLMVRLVAG